MDDDFVEINPELIMDKFVMNGKMIALMEAKNPVFVEIRGDEIFALSDEDYDNAIKEYEQLRKLFGGEQ